MDFNSIDNIKNFLEFIRSENDKLFPKKKAPQHISIRHPEMQDDSVSEITELEKDEILVKYTGETMSMLDKKRRDRIASRKRLHGDNYRSDEDPIKSSVIKKHDCKGPPDVRIRADNDENDKIQVEIRHIDPGTLMNDEV